MRWHQKKLNDHVYKFKNTNKYLKISQKLSYEIVKNYFKSQTEILPMRKKTKLISLTNLKINKIGMRRTTLGVGNMKINF